MEELPTRRDLTLAYAVSLLGALLTVVVSAVGFILAPAGLYARRRRWA